MISSFSASLACPACKENVQLDDGWIICQNTACSMKYPIRDGIPIMLLSEAMKNVGNSR